MSRNRRRQLETYSLSRTHRKWGGKRIQYYRRAEDRYWNLRSRTSTSWRQSWGDRFIRKHRFEVIDRHNICPGASWSMV